VLASRLGMASVEALQKGHHNVMIGVISNKIHFTPFEKAVKYNRKISDELLKLAEILSL
jgi:6-phosphofructokinase 1